MCHNVHFGINYKREWKHGIYGTKNRQKFQMTQKGYSDTHSRNPIAQRSDSGEAGAGVGTGAGAQPSDIPIAGAQTTRSS